MPRDRPRALDLFCKAGGVSVGLERAGFEVVGVDIEPQPRHRGGRFIQADALAFPLDGYDLIWASPPCQRYTCLKSVFDSSSYPDLVSAVRQRLEAAGSLWVIENVPGAPLRQDLLLCANYFGLRSYRHRIFEASFRLKQPPHPPHLARVNPRKVNRRAHWEAGGYVTVTGDIGSYVGPEAMGIDWMTGNELSQAIPPAYAEWIGRQALEALRAATA